MERVGARRLSLVAPTGPFFGEREREVRHVHGELQRAGFLVVHRGLHGFRRPSPARAGVPLLWVHWAALKGTRGGSISLCRILVFFVFLLTAISPALRHKSPSGYTG